MNFLPKIVYGDSNTTIAFDLPPTKDFLKESFKSSHKTSMSSNGKQQTQWNFNEVTISPTMTFVTETIKTEYETFYLTHASKGKEFKYYPSSDEVEFKTVTLTKKDFKPTILFSTNTVGEFIYEFSIKMRELLSDI